MGTTDRDIIEGSHEGVGMKIDTDTGPQRIVCLTEETTETLYLLGEQHRIVGISGFTVRPPQARKTSRKSQPSPAPRLTKFWSWSLTWCWVFPICRPISLRN